MRNLSLRHRFLLGTILVFVVLGAAVVFLVHGQLYERLEAEFQKRAVLLTTKLAADSVDAVLTEKTVDLQLLLNDYAAGSDEIEYIFVVGAKGEVVAHTFSDGFPVELLGINPVDPDATHSVQALATQRGLLLDIAGPLLHGAVGEVHVGFSEERIQESVTSLVKLVAVAVLVALLLAAVGAFALAGIITGPISDLMKITEAVGKGDLERQVRVRSGDEIGQLAQAFNAMILERRRAEEELLRNYEVQRTVSALLGLLKEDTPLDPLLARALEIVLSPPPPGCVRRGCIFLVDEKSGVLNVHAAIDMPEDCREVPRSAVPLDGSPCGRAALTREIQFSPGLDPTGDSLHADPHYCIPIVAPIGVVGVLNLGLESSDHLSDREEEALLSIAGALASLIVYRLTENEKKAVQKQLLRSQKVEAIGRLAGGLAHDLNNLLGAIQGFTEKSLMQVSDGQEPLRDALEHAHGAAVRASDLVSQLLVFGHKQPTPLAPMDVSASVAEVVSMVRPLIGEDISVETELAQDLPPVMADAGSIEQVVMNLSLNARDAMPRGGKLAIHTEEIVLDAKACQSIDGAFPDRFVRLTVTDTGVGIAKEDLDRIFDPFFSTKEMGSGTGLGLSVAHGIVKRLEGWINVESELGRGTTFRVYLLAFAGKPEQKPKSDVPMTLLRGRGERILVVEDEAFVREFAASTLAEQGYEVVATDSAEDALDLFRREEDKFDLLFTDVVLPGRTGVQLAEELTSLRPELAVLLTSAYIDEKAGWHIIREKGFPFLKKPYRMALLLSTIRTVLAEVTRRDVPGPRRS